MKQLRKTLLAVVLVLITLVTFQLNDNLSELANRIDSISADVYRKLDLTVLDSCGIITNGMGHGSCVAIRPNLVLTAGHCVLGFPDGWIEIRGIKYEIKSKWRSEKYDVGFILIDGKVPYLELGSMPEILQVVYKVGHPDDPNFINFISEGIVSNLNTSLYIWKNIIIIDSPGIGGQSGGAIFNKQNKIVAIHVGHISYGFGVAEPVSHIREALEEYDNATITG